MKLSAKLSMIFFATIALCSCTTSLLSLPDPGPQACPPPAPTPVCPQIKATVCPSVPMPPPIPNTVRLLINGDELDADGGGIALIKEYAKTRKIIKALWPEQYQAP